MNRTLHILLNQEKRSWEEKNIYWRDYKMGFRETWTEYQLDAYSKTDYESFRLQPEIRTDIEDLAREYEMEVDPHNRKDRLRAQGRPTSPLT